MRMALAMAVCAKQIAFASFFKQSPHRNFKQHLRRKAEQFLRPVPVVEIESGDTPTVAAGKALSAKFFDQCDLDGLVFGSAVKSVPSVIRFTLSGLRVVALHVFLVATRILFSPFARVFHKIASVLSAPLQALSAFVADLFCRHLRLRLSHSAILSSCTVPVAAKRGWLSSLR